MSRTWRARLLRPAPVAALASLALLALLFFWKIALTNRVLAGLDVFAYFYPYRQYAAEALRSGRLPLWNPHLFMGAPFLANSQAAVLYPLHWPLLWLSAPKQVAWSIVLHIWIAAAGTYLFARRSVGLRPLAAWVAAALFGLGGFLGAQVEHLNQLNASAWLPWLLLCLDGFRVQGRRRWAWLLLGGLVVGLVLLAGHTQATYIVLSGAAAYGIVRGVGRVLGARPDGRALWQGLGPIISLAAMGVAGAMLAAGQLVPTAELSRLSVRSGGLPYREAVSFSLKPGLVAKAFLPPFFWEPPLSEYVAYVGLAGLALAAAGVWVRFRPRHGTEGVTWRAMAGRPEMAVLVLALLGLFLAFGAYNPIYYVLYKVAPGFDLFRAPARWLLLYAYGAAVLGGVGLEALTKRRLWQAGIAALVVIELLVARQKLAYNHPTAPAAFDSMRTATAHLLADPGTEPFRFLSLSDIEYDPGDMADLEAMYGGRLSDRELYDLVVASKMKEVLAYNLPLRYGLDSVDGYDGGLLPTRRYVTLERLFLPEEEIWPDGRLRQQLPGIPAARLLALLNVKYAITDKLQDVWVDDVYYDLEHAEPLGSVELCDLPDFETTEIGVVSYLTGTQQIVDGREVAAVVLTGTDGNWIERRLRAGIDTAEGAYQPGAVAHAQARIAHGWRRGGGNDYLAVLGLASAQRVQCIEVRSLLPPGEMVLRGLTLIDRRTGTSRSVSIDPAYRLAHSGDVKIYQDLAAGSRAFFAGAATVTADDDEALAALGSEAFDAGRNVVVAGGGALSGEATGAVTLVDYRPERVELQVEASGPGYVVLADSYYPGWTATVDGQTVPIRRADVYFRAVAVGGGTHRVVFEFRPVSVRVGLAISLAGILIWLAALVIEVARTGQKRTNRV